MCVCVHMLCVHACMHVHVSVPVFVSIPVCVRQCIHVRMGKINNFWSLDNLL